MILATPLTLGTLGEIYAERSGVLNLGIEGMMATGAAVGVIGAFMAKSAVVGALLGMVSGGVLALGFGLVTINFKGMQVPAGLGLFLFGLGLSGVIGRPYVGLDLPYNFSPAPVPVLSEIPVLGEFLFSHGPLVYLALALVPIMWFILFKTKLGLHIRSVGEDPGAADSAGVNVTRIRYLCVIIGGILAGLGGAFLSLSWTPGWTEGMSAGRGWIVIALTIFALWNPLRALMGAWLFGGIFALQYQFQGMGIPVRILGMFPYLITIVALALVLIFYERIGAPSALLKPYERE
ncbi:ABC transporter permease [candidate division MSBL1 archaeon SCGC-AAA833F18]|uniref:ABC transporter permease n=3 Tax=candidate division MSBL1 TaxID=215777 RepID=A0A133V1D1_9EURY|nr:ABC transporter permease [candidate division MSBL1 archaeon SCGC-AAA261C02]KXB03923.1 ABC transporter permease [candidate division MSBL1 archaeon SCGC-AAA261G05]KXB09470.1 ABC transporter permease [candidate division MSBL1 archaeon SCGC-AAA833F18]